MKDINLNEKIGEITTFLREIPGWTEEVQQTLITHMSAVYYKGAVAIWLPQVSRIGGVYNIQPTKQSPKAIPFDKSMPSINLDCVESVSPYRGLPRNASARILDLIKTGAVATVLVTAPMYVVLAWVGAKVILPPVVIYAFEAKEEFFEGAHLSAEQTPAYLMLSKATYSRHAFFWRYWAKSHR